MAAASTTRPTLTKVKAEEDLQPLKVLLQEAGLDDIGLDEEKEPELVATLWKGAGQALRVQDMILKVIRQEARLSMSQAESYRAELAFYVHGFAARARQGGAPVPRGYVFGEVAEEDEDGGGKKSKGKKKKKKKKKTKAKRKRGGAKANPRLPILGDGARFFSLMTDMTSEFPESTIDFSKEQAVAALKWIARFHATFMGTVGEAVSSHGASVCERDHSRALRGLWSRGCFWNLYRSREQFRDVERTYAREVSARLAKEYPELLRERPGIALLAQRLKAAGEVLDRRLLASSPGNSAAWFTILHGDLKGANFALKKKEGDEGEWEAGVFDFQWSGAGLGARGEFSLRYFILLSFFRRRSLVISSALPDIAYFVISCALPVYVETAEAEDELLRVYFKERQSRARQRPNVKKSKGDGKGKGGGGGGGGGEMNFQQFRLLYDVAFCDFMRWLLGYGLWGGPLEAWSLARADDILARADRHGVGEVVDYEEAFRG